jgi:hypothetical protein
LELFRKTVGTVPRYKNVGTVPKYKTVGTVPKYKTVGTVPKNKTVGTVPKYKTVETVPKYKTVGTVPKYKTIGTVPKYKKLFRQSCILELFRQSCILLFFILLANFLKQGKGELGYFYSTCVWSKSFNGKLFHINKERNIKFYSFLRELVWLSAIHNFNIKAKFISGRNNVIADSASRLHEVHIEKITFIISSTTL